MFVSAAQGRYWVCVWDAGQARIRFLGVKDDSADPMPSALTNSRTTTCAGTHCGSLSHQADPTLSHAHMTLLELFSQADAFEKLLCKLSSEQPKPTTRAVRLILRIFDKVILPVVPLPVKMWG